MTDTTRAPAARDLGLHRAAARSAGACTCGERHAGRQACARPGQAHVGCLARQAGGGSAPANPAPASPSLPPSPRLSRHQRPSPEPPSPRPIRCLWRSPRMWLSPRPRPPASRHPRPSRCLWRRPRLWPSPRLRPLLSPRPWHRPRPGRRRLRTSQRYAGWSLRQPRLRQSRPPGTCQWRLPAVQPVPGAALRGAGGVRLFRRLLRRTRSICFAAAASRATSTATAAGLAAGAAGAALLVRRLLKR